LFNCGAVERGRADIGFTMADVAYQAYNQGTDVDPEPYRRIRAMVAIYDNVVQLVTYRDSPIETVPDLRGKRVGVGAPGSGTEFNARRVLEGHGLRYSDIKADYLSFSEIVQQLKNQTIDAGFINASYPVSAIMDLDASVGVKLVPIEPDRAEAIRALDPNYFPTVLPGGTYKSIRESAYLSRGSRRGIGLRADQASFRESSRAGDDAPSGDASIRRTLERRHHSTPSRGGAFFPRAGDRCKRGRNERAPSLIGFAPASSGRSLSVSVSSISIPLVSASSWRTSIAPSTWAVCWHWLFSFRR
jgi:hypothetical protein